MVALAEMTQVDRDDVERMVRRHAEETGSPVAQALLDDWERAIGQFRKVMPNDYQRVLDATARAEAEGLDVVETIMAASQPA